MRKISYLIMKYVGSDGLMHFSLSAAATAVLKQVMPWWAAMSVTMICGIAKEIYDKVSKKGTPEWKDLACDLAGNIVGAL